ncbi:MAG: ribosomal RNA small subunit methyltransferase A [Chloroflexi bacterium RBG_13_56_8]|nr:MAG: ribosomal RNA small subunit methyltransferase A [Chloroflexi bacterium RBG_13_56_8]
MDPISLLKRYDIRPSKGLGQNFLIREGVVERILEASELSPQDLVLEVGAGLGLLTRRLAERASAVVAVELDRKMVPILADTLQGAANVHIVQADILQVDPPQLMVRELALPDMGSLRYKVVANLPYYITSAVLRHLLDTKVRPERLVVMVQKEVAQRIVASAGDLSLLAISVQVFGMPEIITSIPASAFYPRPKVDSALLRVCVYEEPRVPEEEIASFFRVVRAGFGQKRRQLHNSLMHNLHLPHDAVLAALHQANIAPARRPQTLEVEEWVRLACFFKAEG